MLAIKMPKCNVQLDCAALFAIISILKESSKSRTGKIFHEHFAKPKASITIHISKTKGTLSRTSGDHIAFRRLG